MYTALSMEDYITDDTYQAAVFVSLGFDMKEMDDRELKIKFVFERTPEFESMIKDYLGRKLLIEPFNLKSCMDTLYDSIKYLRPKKWIIMAFGKSIPNMKN